MDGSSPDRIQRLPGETLSLEFEDIHITGFRPCNVSRFANLDYVHLVRCYFYHADLHANSPLSLCKSPLPFVA